VNRLPALIVSRKVIYRPRADFRFCPLFRSFAGHFMAKKFRLNADILGIGTSVACAIHCAVLPLFLSSFPLLGINIIHNAVFEFSMIGLAFVIGLLAFRHGYRRHHRSLVPFALFSAGMLFLLAKQYWHTYELLLLPFAVVFIVTAHVFNHRMKRSSRGETKMAIHGAGSC
jgi:hypothetical protein